MELQILTLVIEGIIGAGISFLGWRLKKVRDIEEELKRREQLFEEMEMLNTRLNLIRECHHYVEKGFAPVYARATVVALYRAYHSVGGNGGIEGIYKDFLDLPTMEAVKK